MINTRLIFIDSPNLTKVTTKIEEIDNYINYSKYLDFSHDMIVIYFFENKFLIGKEVNGFDPNVQHHDKLSIMDFRCSDSFEQDKISMTSYDELEGFLKDKVSKNSKYNCARSVFVNYSLAELTFFNLEK